MSELQVQRLSADVCAAGQLDAQAMSQAAQAGFKSVINNRPDFEGGPTQPTSASLEAAAKAAGLSYAYLPVQSGYQSEDDVRRFAELLESLPKPILAFCRSGARTSHLYMLACHQDD